jgi:hypothetical protein
LLLVVFNNYSYAQTTYPNDVSQPRASDEVIQLTREFSRELFDANGSNWAKPLVEATNASVNSRFFSDAFIPRNVDKPYFKFSIHMSTGFIPDNRQWMQPDFATEEFSLLGLAPYVDVFNGTVKDTSGLGLYLLKTLINDGLENGEIEFPERSPTLLGPNVNPEDNAIIIKEGALQRLLQARIDELGPAADALNDEVIALLNDNLEQVPTYFTLPNGSGMNSMTFGVPQIEIGSLYGTELLIRYIPQLDYGENIGEFGFWGVGLKHSLSQYFFDADSLRTFDLATQVAYQNSTLDQVFGETNGTFNAVADIFNWNLHGSYNINEWWGVYSGYQFELLNINSKIKYFIGVEQQRALGMLPTIEELDENGDVIITYEPTEERPGDTEPQFTDIGFEDINHKFVIGTYVHLGPVMIAADYNISQFNLFSLGIKYIYGQ